MFNLKSLLFPDYSEDIACKFIDAFSKLKKKIKLTSDKSTAIKLFDDCYNKLKSCNINKIKDKNKIEQLNRFLTLFAYRCAYYTDLINNSKTSKEYQDAVVRMCEISILSVTTILDLKCGK